MNIARRGKKEEMSKRITEKHKCLLHLQSCTPERNNEIKCLTLRELRHLEEDVSSRHVCRGGGIWLGQKAGLPNCGIIKTGKKLREVCFCFLPLRMCPAVPESMPVVTQTSDANASGVKPLQHRAVQVWAGRRSRCVGSIVPWTGAAPALPRTPPRLENKGEEFLLCTGVSLLGWGWSPDSEVLLRNN